MALDYVQLFQSLLAKREEEKQRKQAQQQAWGQAIGTALGAGAGLFTGGAFMPLTMQAGGQLGKVAAGGDYTTQDAGQLLTAGLGSLGAAQSEKRTGIMEAEVARRVEGAGLARDVAQNRLLTAGYSPYEFKPRVDAPPEESMAWIGEQAYQKLDTEGYDPASLEAMFRGTPEKYEATATIPFGEKGRFTVKRRAGTESPEFSEPELTAAPAVKSRNLLGKVRDAFASGTPALDETIAHNYDVDPGLVRTLGTEFKGQTGRWPDEKELEALVVRYLEL